MYLYLLDLINISWMSSISPRSHQSKQIDTKSRSMGEENWVWSRSHDFHSETDQGQKVVIELLQYLEQDNWAEDDVFGIHLAVEEAVANAIKHGNKLDPAKRVQVSMQCSAELLRIEVEDEGSGFDPDDVPDPTQEENLELPSGRGIMLMRNFMSFVEFNSIGNRVVMEKRRGS